jgi:hypothetical protein
MIASSAVSAATGGFDAIDHILALDLGGRGIAAFFTPGAALRAARALRGARRILIVTGFSVPPGIAETDGPPGAAVLGRALRQLGATVHHVIDPPAVAPLCAALRALGEPSDVVVYEPGRGGELLARLRPTHLVAIERPGRSRSGEYLSARGESIGSCNGPLDELFVADGRARRRPAPGTAGRRAPRPVTIGVGDGGNEIGMGNVRARLVRQGALMARIASVVRVDHLVVAGTSNWGAYGIVAGLERLTRRALLHTAEDERRLVRACVGAGAVDGLLRHREPTVDGLPLGVHAAVVELLRRAAPDTAARRAAARARRSGMMEPPMGAPA